MKKDLQINRISNHELKTTQHWINQQPWNIINVFNSMNFNITIWSHVSWQWRNENNKLKYHYADPQPIKNQQLKYKSKDEHPQITAYIRRWAKFQSEQQNGLIWELPYHPRSQPLHLKVRQLATDWTCCLWLSLAVRSSQLVSSVASVNRMYANASKWWTIWKTGHIMC